jgi:phosphate-selective porin OprO and OprP
MFRTRWGLLGTLTLAATLAAESASAQSAPASGDRIDQLEAHIKALEREIQGLKAKSTAAEKKAEKAEKAYDTATPAVKAPPPAVAATAVAKMSPGNRPSICTLDGLNCVAITTRFHFDAGGYWYRPNSASTTPQSLDNGVNARRARIGLLGTFMGDWNYALIYDFGSSSDGLPPLSGAPISGIENAFVSYTGLKPLSFEFGYMDTPFTLDEATTSNDIMFMERSSSQVVAANIVAGDFRSAAGIRGNDDRFWAGVYLTGPTSGTTHISTPTATAAGTPGTLGSPGFAEQIGGFGRVAYQLLQDPNYSLHIGADAAFLIKPPGTNTLTLSDRLELRIDPTTILSTGAIANVAHAQVYDGELAAGYGPLFFQAEYVRVNVDRLLGLPSVHFNGWYAEGSWTITGESRKYNPAAGAYVGIVPNNPFSLSMGGWGAWEIGARYSHVDLNDLFTPGIPTTVTNGVAGGVQNVVTVGLNWYLNRNMRFMVNYLHGTVDKFSGAAGTAGTDIGAHFDALAMRTQVAF